MKKLFFFCALIMGAISLNAQARVSTALPLFEAKSAKLTEAIGWDSTLGKWTDNKNVISDQRGVKASGRNSNFTWAQCGSFHYKHKKYYIFYAEYVSGRYKYPSIYEDWYDYQAIEYFLLDSIQYGKLKSVLKDEKGRTTYIQTTYDEKGSSMYSEFDEAKFYSGIMDNMERWTSPDYSYDYCFPVNCQKLEGKDIVRFGWAGTCDIKYSNFERSYFEVPLEEFKKLLID